MTTMTTLEAERMWMSAHRFGVWLLAWLVGVCIIAGAFTWQRGKYERLLAEHRALALRAANDSAALDSTRHVALSRRDSISILGDSLQAVTRLTVQTAGERDRLDRALNQTRVANAQLVATVRELRAHGSSVVSIDSADVRRATFAVDTTPYHAVAAVQLPAAGLGSIDLHVRLDPAHLTVRPSCLARNRDGIRPASITILSPNWLDVKIDKTEQDPEVCNATPKLVHRWIGYPDLVGGVGRIFSSSGSGWGAFVGVGAHVGP